ncbi:MAG: insulinase family protein [Bacteroidota bacterium]|nr:insulinase family protein [Bacteroidota bacterium]
MQKILHIAALTLLSFSASAQFKLVEKVTRNGADLVIPYEKYLMPNGLTILVHEDHSDPVVYVDVTYHVGSAREQEGRSGFAHFFEHMMFQGSEHVADEQHFKIVTEAGGTLNGTTNLDRTNYFEVVPSNQLETALWLESDRMGFLLDSVTQKKFEVQRATVKNERGQNYDNKPYGLAGEKTSAALYPTTHPYSWLTIGYIEDLNRVDVNDLKKFFLRWYGPNNATLTVAGDVTVAEVLKLAEKYFGPIPKGPEVNPRKFPEPVLEKDRYVSYEDNIRAPQLTFTFPTVAARTEDEAALDILADVLGGNKSSLFYQNFVKTQLAQMAAVYHPTAELSGTMNISIRTFQDKSLAPMDSLVRVTLAQFEKRGVTDEDIKKFYANFEAQYIQSLSSVQGKGSILASNQTFTGNPNYLKEELARYSKVTKEDVMRVYNKYMKNKFAVILSIYPKGKPSLVAQKDNFTYPVRNVNAAEGAEYKSLVYNKTKDTFDRSIKPAAGPAPVVKSPVYWTRNFDNGLKVTGSQTDEVPSIAIQISIEAGHRYESPSKAGVSQLLTSILNESTKKHTAEEIGEKLESMGSSVQVYNTGQDIVVSVSSLTKNIDSTLAITEEILFSPKFDEAEFARIKKQRLEAIDNQVTQGTTIANNVYAKLLYGNNHIMSISSLGTKETVSAITLDDVKKFYKDYFSPAISSAVIVGNISQEQALAKVGFLKNWKGDKVVHLKEPALPKIDKTRIYFVHKDKSPQSEIRIGYMGMPYDATGEYYKNTIMNYALGGAFNSRINLNLREKNGFTYGARSSFSGNQFAGPYTAAAGVRSNATDSSIVEFMKEIKLYSEKGISPEELAFTKSAMAQGEALKYETAMQKAGFIKRIMDYNLDPAFTVKQNEILKNMTKADVDALAKKHLPLDRMAILVVGDKSKVYENLKKLGYEVVELDTDGNPVKPVVQKSETVEPPVEGDKNMKPGKLKMVKEKAAER